MNKERLQWGLLVVIALGMVLLGYAIYQQSARLETINNAPIVTSTASGTTTIPSSTGTMASTTMGSSSSTTGVPAPSVRIQNISDQAIDGAPSIHIVTRCVGGNVSTKVIGEGMTVASCLGTTQLIMQEAGKEYPINERMVVAEEDATLVVSAQLIRNSETNFSNQIMIVSSEGYCAKNGGCGDGVQYTAPKNQHVYVYTLGTHLHRELLHFPLKHINQPMWNSDFTKAILYPAGCSEAGCVPNVLIGYDLTTDTQSPATQETAVTYVEAGSAEAARDEQGHQLATWGNVEWTGTNTFRAQLTSPNGATRYVSGRL